jgi:MFS family permease
VECEFSPRYPGWRVVAAALLGVMVGYSVLIPYTFSLFIKPLGTEFGWRRDQISVALGCVAITIAACSPLIGRLLDVFGTRRTILPCLVIFGLGFSSLSLLSPSLPRFYLTFVLLGLAGNGTTQLAYSRAVSTWFFARRGLALSMVSSGAGAGAMILPLLASWLLRRDGWRTTYAILGLLVLVTGVPLTLALVKESHRAPFEKRGPSSSESARSAVLKKPFLLLVGAIFFYSVTFNGMISHLSAVLTDRGISLVASAQALSVMGAAGLVGRVTTGFLLDRFFAVRVSLLFFLATAAGVLFLSLSSVPSAFLGSVIIGFAAGGESDITPYLLSRYFSLQRFSTLYGIAWTAFAVGTAIGPVLMGRLYDSTGAYQSWGIQLFAFPTLLSAALMVFMPAYPATASSARSEPLPAEMACSDGALLGE